MTGPAVRDLTAWWEDLRAAALVGTVRRQVPQLPTAFGPGRAAASREVALLDGAALGSALRRAGSRARRPVAGDAAGEDVRPPAPPRAVQLLELLLHQSPVGPALTPDSVRRWLEAADARDRRVPHHVLPELLDLGARHQDLRALVRRVGDARGAWLATANPDWAWAVNQDEASNGAAPHVDAIAWARLPTDQRAREVVRLRSSDPESARDLVASTWSSDAAADRVALLAALRTGTGPGDEPLLERALDDRSNQVREVAVHLLDALPGSARGGRMAERLRPLLRLKGRLRKSLQVDLPQDPDAIGVRDGLTRPKKVGSVRGWWLQRLAAGAPLEIWTDATDADPATTWRMVDQADARAGIVEAVLARGDQAWAAPIAENVWHPRLLSLVPAERMDVIACRQLANASTAAQVVSVVSAVPTPWGLEFSRAIVKRLLAEKDPSVLLAQLSSQLAGGLDPATRPSLEQWRDRLEGGSRDRVVRICQFLSLVAEIPEAFT